MVHVYGKPGCVQCKFTMKKLDDLGVPYQDHDVTVEPEAEAIVRATGRLELPLVVAGEQSWHGYRPDHLKSLALISA